MPMKDMHSKLMIWKERVFGGEYCRVAVQETLIVANKEEKANDGTFRAHFHTRRGVKWTAAMIHVVVHVKYEVKKRKKRLHIEQRRIKSTMMALRRLLCRSTVETKRTRTAPLDSFFFSYMTMNIQRRH